MKLYFSGISSVKEFDLLQAAGIRYALATPFDLENIPVDWEGEVWLDSAAYPEFKNSSLKLEFDQFVELAEKAIASRHCLHVNMPDVIGNPAMSYRRWQLLRQLNLDHIPWVPIWQWGSPEEWLWEFMENAPIVGIGGCVPWLKVVTKGQPKAAIAAAKALRQQNFMRLKQLVEAVSEVHGSGRCHLLGNCWETSLEELGPLLFSSDTSHWLTPKRSGCCVFRNSRTQKLSKAPARALPNARGWTLDERCIQSAQSMADFFGNPCYAPVAV
jgi:hypothetical protein